MSTVVKIDSRGKITIPRSILKELNIAQGDYVQVDLECGQAVLRPRKLIDPSQSWYWTPEWREKEAEVDREVDSQGLSPSSGFAE